MDGWSTYKPNALITNKEKETNTEGEDNNTGKELIKAMEEPKNVRDSTVLGGGSSRGEPVVSNSIKEQEKQKEEQRKNNPGWFYL